MVTGPPCQRCGYALKWFAEHHSWGCDRCRMMFPAAGAAAQPQTPPPGPPPVGPAPVGRPVATPVVAAPGAKSSSKLPLILVAAAVAVGGAIAGVLLLRGGGGGGVGSQDDVVKQSLTAMGAGDVDALVKLADVETLMGKAIECTSKDAEDDMDPGKQASKLRRRFERDAEKTKGMAIELVEIEKGDRKDKALSKGDKAGKGCVAKVDVAMHRVTAKIKVKQGDKAAREGTAEIEVIEVDGGWYLGDPPRIKAGPSCEAAVARAVKETRKELDKLPSFSDTTAKRLEESVVRRCKTDAWSEDALDCMVDEDRVSSIDFCIKKLTAEHQKSLQSEIERAVVASRSTTPDVPVTPSEPVPTANPDVPTPPDDPDVTPDVTPAETGSLAAVGLPDCEAYRQGMQKLIGCSALPQQTRDLYKRALTSLMTSWGNISGTTAAAVKKSMNDMCKRSIGTLQSVATGCL